MNENKGLGRDFWIYRFGRSIYSFVASALMIGVSVWVIKTTDSPSQLALVLVPMNVVALILGPVFGPYVDRYSKKKLMLSAEFLSIIPLSVATFLFYADQLTTIILSGLFVVFQCFRSIYNATSSVILPNIVKKEQMGDANAKIQGIEAFIEIIGGVIGGIIVAMVSFGFLLGLTIGALMVSLITILLLRLQAEEPDTRKQVKADDGQHSSWSSEFKSGLSYLWKKKVLVSLSAYLAIISFFMGPLAVTLEVMVLQDFKLEANYIGYLLSAVAVGHLLSMFFYGLFSAKVPQPLYSSLFIFMMGACLVLMGITANYYWILFFVVLLGLSNGLLVIPFQTLLVASIDAQYRGRVMNLIGTFISALAPLSIIVAAQVLEITTAFKVFLVSGVLIMIVSTMLFAMPVLGRFLKLRPEQSTVWLRRLYDE